MVPGLDMVGGPMDSLVRLAGQWLASPRCQWLQIVGPVGSVMGLSPEYIAGPVGTIKQVASLTRAVFVRQPISRITSVHSFEWSSRGSGCSQMSRGLL